MNLNYKVETSPVTELVFVTHKAKRRDFELSQHAHCYHEIIYVDYGSVLLEMEPLDTVIKPGYIIFIANGKSHKFHGIAGAPFDFLNICYTGLLPESIADRPLKIAASERNLLKRIKDEANCDLPYSKDIAVTLLGELIFMLRRQGDIASPLLQYTASNSELYHSAIVQQSMGFIEEHFAENGVLDKVCKNVGLSKSYLRALVKKETGHSFGHHIQQFRVATARKMLLESTLSLKEIVNLVGYESLPFFFKIFRRITGMTPMEYAKSLGTPEDIN